MSFHIFVSHIEEEADLALAIQEQVREEFGSRVVTYVSSDRHSIKAAERWLDGLTSAVREADLVVVLCSEESLTRQWVNFEAGAAWVLDKKIVPVCHSGLTPDRLPRPLDLFMGVELTDPAGLDKLHDAIAEGMEPAVADLDQTQATDRTDFIERCRSLEQKLRFESRLRDPTVLCAFTDRFDNPYIDPDADIELLHRFFGDRVRVERNLTIDLLRDFLLTQRSDILHLIIDVDPETGDLVFPEPRQPNPDRLPASAFGDLLQRSVDDGRGPEIVFLATCEALYLANTISNVTNMVASHVRIDGGQIVKWAECFYSYLRRGDSLSEAGRASTSQVVDVPLRLVLHHDLAFVPW